MSLSTKDVKQIQTKWKTKIPIFFYSKHLVKENQNKLQNRFRIRSRQTFSGSFFDLGVFLTTLASLGK